MHKVKILKCDPKVVFARCSCGWNTANDTMASYDNDRGLHNQLRKIFGHIKGHD